MEYGASTGVEHAQALILEAMIDAARWEDALDAFARACGGYVGQCVALNGKHEVTSHWIVGADDDLSARFEAFGFADPVRNPRFRLGLVAPLMTAVADQDHVDRDERRRNVFYQEMYNPNDLPFTCQAVLQRDDEAFVRVSATRSHKQGPFDAGGMRAFNALVPHLSAAMRMRVKLQQEQSLATLRTLDMVGATAFLFNESGAVIGASASAAAMAEAGDVLQISAGALRLRAPAEQKAFESALARLVAAVRARTPVALTPLYLSGGALVLDLQMLPRERVAFPGAPALLAVIRPAAWGERAGALQAAYGLTRAEVRSRSRLPKGMS